MGQLRFDPAWDEKFARWAEKALAAKASMKRFCQMELPNLKTETQRIAYHRIEAEKQKTQEQQFREWLIGSGIIDWAVQCEAEKGLSGMGKRIAAEWGEIANEYDLKEYFNKAFENVRNQYRQNG